MALTRIGEALFSLLAGAPEVTSLVGTSPSRIYPGVLPQTCGMPAVVYQVVVDVPLTSLQGYTSKLRNVRVQVDAYALTYDGAQALADAACTALGAQLSPSLSLVQLSRRDLYEDDTQRHRVSSDFSLWSQDS